MSAAAPPRKTRSRRRWFLLILILAGLLASGARYMLMTTAGAQAAARLLMRLESRLSLQVTGGSLWRGLQLSRISWKNENADITLSSLDARWQITLFPEPALHVQQANAEDLRILLKPESPPPAARQAQAASLTLPFHLRAGNIRMIRTTFQRGDLSAELAEITFAGDWHGEDLALESIQLQQLAIRDDRPVEPEPAEPLPWAERLQPEHFFPLTLPVIEIPLNLEIGEASLSSGSYSRGAEIQRIDSVNLSAECIGQTLSLHHLEIRSSLGNLQGEGSLQFSGDMPVDLHWILESDALLSPHSLAIEGRLDCSLGEPAFYLRLDGPGIVELSGQVRLLEPDLPMEVTMAWKNLGWPLEGVPFITSTRGLLELKGTPQSCSIQLSGDLAGKTIPDGFWFGTGSGNLQHLALESLKGELLDGTLEANGKLSWTNGLAWQLTLMPDSIDARFFHDELPADISGKVETAGTWQASEWEALIDISSLRADWKGLPVEATGQLSGDNRQAWSTTGLRITQQNNSLQLTGSVAAEADLCGSFDLQDIPSLLPELNGTLKGTWQISGPVRNPDIGLSLDATGMAYRGIQVSRAHLNADLQDWGKRKSRIELEVNSLGRPGKTNWMESLKLTASGTQTRHEATLETAGPLACLGLKLTGSLAEQSSAWTGTLQQTDIAIAGIDWSLRQPVRMKWNPEAGQLTLAPHHWTHRQAELRAPEPLILGRTGQAKLDLVRFDLSELGPWLPDLLGIQGLLGAGVDIRWTHGQLEQAEASADVQEGAIKLLPPPSELVEDTPPVEIAYDTIHLDTRLVSAGQLDTQLSIASEHLGRAHAESRLFFSTNRIPDNWTGRIDLESVRLELLQPFLPELRTLSGQADASIQLSGHPFRPMLHGTLSITNGQVEAMKWPVLLDDVHLYCDLQGKQANLSGEFRSGTGSGHINGTLETGDPAWNAMLELTGDRLDLSYDTFAVFQASPQLTLHLAPEQLDLKGSILIPRAEITIRKLPDSAIRPSPDVRIAQDPSAASEPASNPAPSEWNRDIHLDLQLGDQVRLSGYGITSRLQGHLLIQQSGNTAPGANGKIRIADGHFKALGQNLQIRTGEFLFAGPLNRPTLYVEAIRDVTEYMVVAGIRVEGPVDALRTTLFSQPSLPQDEILPYLLLGRPLERGDGGAADGMLASAALSLGLSSGQGRVKNLAERVGIDNFTIGAEGGDSGTEVVVSGQVSDRLQVSYGSSVFADSTTLTLRYRLARNLFLEAVSSLASSLELIYSFAY